MPPGRIALGNQTAHRIQSNSPRATLFRTAENISLRVGSGESPYAMRFTIAFVLATVACGGSIDHPRMCARLENGECPEGLDMFLRKEKRLHLSGERAGAAGTKVRITIEDVSEADQGDEGDEEFYSTETVLGKDDKVVVPLEPGAFRTGAYRLSIWREGEKPDHTIEFSVWNTQAEIDARKGLKSFGARLSEIRICKNRETKECEESYSKLPASSKEFRFSFKYRDAEAGSEFSLNVLRNGTPFHSMKRPLDSESGIISGYIGYDTSVLPRGKYSLVFMSTKSKQGAITRTVVIE